MTINNYNLKKIIGVIAEIPATHKLKQGSVEQIIRDRLTPRLFGKTLISGDTIEGKATFWVRRQLEIDTQIGARWDHILKNALTFFPKKDISGLSIFHFNQLKMLRSKAIPNEGRLDSALESLKTLINAHERERPKKINLDWTEDSKKLKSWSLLDKVPTTPNSSINSSILQSLILGISNSSPVFLKNVYSYIKPLLISHKDADTYEACSLMDQGVELDDYLLKVIENGKESLKRSDAKKELADIAKSTTLNIENLKQNESYLIISGCPAQPSKVHLKEDRSNSDWYPQVKGFLEDDKVEEIAQALMKHYYPVGRAIINKQLSSNFSQELLEAWQEGLMNYFFPRLMEYSWARKIADHYSGRLSEIINEELSQYISRNQILKWQKALSEDRLEDEIKIFLKENLPKVLKILREKNSGFILSALDSMPPLFSDVLSILGHADWGEPEKPLWIEIKKTSDEYYSLIFQSTQTYEFQKLTSAELTPEFFNWLYSRKAESEWSYGTYYSPKNILEGMKGFLKNEPVEVKSSLNEGYWGILNNFLKEKNVYGTTNGHELFVYNLQKQAFLDMWSHVKGNPKRFDRKLFLNKTLIDSAQTLARRASELYNEGSIGMTELKVVYATTWEACEILKNQEKTPQTEKSLVPYELRLILSNLLKNVGGWNSFAIECLKDWFTGLAGFEMEGAVDILFNEILLEPSNIVQKTVLANVEGPPKKKRIWEKWPEVRLFRYSRTIYRVNRVAKQVLLILENVVWETIALVARKAFIPVMTFILPGPTKTLRRYAIKLAGWSLANIFLNKEQMTKIQDLVKSWEQNWMRGKEISYSVEYSLPRWKTVNIRRQLPRIVLPLPKTEPQEPINELIPKILTVNEYNIFNFLKTCREEINSISSVSEKSHVKFFYLNRQLQNLPIPKNEADCWDLIPQHQVLNCMEQISDLAFELYKNAWDGFGKYSIFERSRLIVNLFAVCGIMDKLARRCPESNLEGFMMNPWGFALWLRRAPISFIDPTIKNRVKEACSYFRIDLKRNYTETEIQQLGMNSLFFQTRNSKNGETLSLPADLNCSPAEINYYQQLLDRNPSHLNRRLVYNGIPENAASVDKLTILYTDPSFLKSEWNKSNLQGDGEDPRELFNPNDPRKGLLPRSFFLLRFWNLLCNETVASNDHKRGWGPCKLNYDRVDEWTISIEGRNSLLRRVFTCDSNNNEKVDSPFRGHFLPYTILKDDPSSLVGRTHTQPDILSTTVESSPDWEARPTILNKTKTKQIIQLINDFLHGKNRNQNEIMNDPPTFEKSKPTAKSNFLTSFLGKFGLWRSVSATKDDEAIIDTPLKDLKEDERRLLEMVWTHRSDQVIRTLSFFNQKLEFFDTPNREFLYLFDVLLMQGGLLSDQLEEQPEFVITLGKFFKDALERYPPSSIPEISLELLRIGLVVQATSEATLKGSADYFPRFREMIRKKENWSEQLKTKRAFILLLPHLQIDPRLASLEQTQEIIKDLCLTQTLVSNIPDDPLACVHQDLWQLWKPQISEHLNRNVEFRNHVLNDIIYFQESRGTIADNGVWEGNFPYFRSIDSFCNLTDTNAVMNFSNEVQCEKIKKWLKKIVGTSCEDLKHEKHGVYRLPSSNIVIEIDPYNATKNKVEQRLFIYVEHQGTKCSLVQPKEIKDELPVPPGITRSYWLKEDPKMDPMLLVYENGKLLNSVYIKKGEVIDAEWTTQNILMRPTNVLNEGTTELLDLNKAKHSIGALSSFEELSKIRCLRNLENPNEISEISILGISFKIKEINGSKEAINDEGFFIERNQKDPQLEYYSSYLLLRNELGERKVLFRPQTLLGAFTSSLLKRTDLLTPSLLLENGLTRILYPLLEGTLPFKEAYFTFDLDENGRLMSDNPEALVLLLSYHLLFNHSKEAKFYFNLLQEHAHREILAGSVHDLLSQIEIFSTLVNDPEMILYSLRLRALKEENRLLPLKGKAKVKNPGLTLHPKDKEFLPSLVSWAVAQINIQNYIKDPGKFPRQCLNEYEELFILKGIAEKSEQFLKAGLLKNLDLKFISDYLLNGISGPAEIILALLNDSLLRLPEEMLMMPALAQRFAFLSKKYESQFGPKKKITKRFAQLAIAENRTYAQVDGEEVVSEISFSRRFANWITNNRPLLQDNTYYLKQLNQLSLDIEIKACWRNVPTKYSELTPEVIKRNFLIYYRFVKKEVPEEIKADTKKVKEFYQKADDFLKTLPLMDGRHFDLSLVFLLSWLNATAQNRFFADFPSASDFESLFVRVRTHKKSKDNIIDNSNLDLTSSEINDPKEIDQEALSKLAYAFKGACMRHLLFDKSIFERIGSVVKANLPTFYFGFYSTHKISSKLSYFTAISQSFKTLSKGFWWGNFCSSYLYPVACQGIDLFKKNQRISEAKKELKKTVIVDKPLPQKWAESLTSDDETLGSCLKEIQVDQFKVNSKKVDGVNQHSAYVKPFSYPQDNPLLKFYFEKINKSLEDFAKRNKRVIYNYSIEDILTLHNRISTLKNELESHLTQEEDEILAYVHAPEMEYRYDNKTFIEKIKSRIEPNHKKLTFDDILENFLQDDNPKNKKIFTLTPRKEQELELLLFRYLIKKTRLQQMERCLVLSTKLLDGSSNLNAQEVEKMTQELANELTRKRGYSLSQTSKRFLKTYLLFEVKMNKLLWEIQVAPVQELLTHKYLRAVLEMIMGIGKTSWVMPGVSHLMADGASLVFNIILKTLGKVQIPEISHTSKESFFEDSYSLSIKRNTHLGEKELWAILQMFHRSILYREKINLTKEDLQALECKFIEALERRFINAPNAANDEILSYYMAILEIIGTSGIANIDEVHEILRRQRELNYPFGKKKRLKKSIIRIIRNCTYFLRKHPNRNLLGLEKNLQSCIPEEEYHSKIKPGLVEQFCNYKPFHITEEQKPEFRNYLSNTTSTVPDFVKNSPLIKEMATARGVLNKILPNTLKKIVNVDFGKSKNGNGHNARPYSGNDQQIKSSTIRNPFEAVLKSFIMFQVERLTQDQGQEFLIKLMEKAIKESKKKGIAISRTQTARNFDLWIKDYEVPTLGELVEEFGKADIRSNQFTQLTAKIIEVLNKSDDAVLTYTELVVDSSYFERNIRHNSQNFASMVHSICSYTGTAHNLSIFPVGTEALLTKGTSGDTLSSLRKRCNNPESIIELNGETSQEVFSEILSQFKKNKKLRAIIDCGALFRGLNNLPIARKLLDYIKRERDDIDGIVFYDDKNNKMIWEKNASRPIPLKQSKIKPSRRITLYDHVRILGADIDQDIKAEAIMTIGEDVTTEKLEQAVKRMRQNQNITLVMNRRVRHLISGKKHPQIDDVITFAIRNGATELGEDSFYSDQNQIADVIFRHCMKRLTGASSIKKLLEYYSRYREILITNVENDPVLLYGQKETTKITPHQALEICKTLNLGLLQESERAVPRQKMEQIGKQSIYPVEISIPENPDFLNKNLEAAFGVEQVIEQSLDQEMENEREMHHNVQLDQQQEMQEETELTETDVPKYKVKPAVWNKRDYFLNLEWLTGSDNGHHEQVELYSLFDLMSNSSNEVIRNVHQMFPRKNMICTTNFVGVQNTPGFPLAEIANQRQKPALQLLVVQKKTNSRRRIITTIALDQSDIEFWRKKLAENRSGIVSNKSIKIALYDLNLGCISLTGKNALTNHELEQNDDFQKQAALWKVFNGNPSYSSEELEILKESIFKVKVDKSAVRAFQTWRNRKHLRNASLLFDEDEGIEDCED